MTPPTADDLEIHTRTLCAAAAAILHALAKGKYDGRAEVTGQLLRELGVMLPPAADVEKALEVFFFLNKLTPSAADVLPAKDSYGSQKTGQFV